MKLSAKAQSRALVLVKRTLSEYQTSDAAFKKRMKAVYDEVSTFEGVKLADWSTCIKLNEAFRIENIVVASIIARSPRFIASRANFEKRPKMKDGQPELASDGQPLEEFAVTDEEVNTIQDVLNYYFDKYNYLSALERMAKNGVRYGNGLAKIEWKIELDRFPESIEQDGKKIKRVKEVVGREYPAINVISFKNFYCDHRVFEVGDQPAVIMVDEAVRLVHLKALARVKGLYNLDELERAIRAFEAYNDKTGQLTRARGFQKQALMIDENAMKINKYYGYFAPRDDSDERLMEIWTVNDSIVIKSDEITKIKIADFKCFEDPECFYGVGFLEPMLKLQEEVNFQKNSRAEYVSKLLNRDYLWDPNSGINPKQLVSRPNNVIVANQGMAAAEKGLKELEKYSIDSSVLTETNELRRDISSMTYTIDSNQAGAKSGNFTNFATGQRIQLYQTNLITDFVTKHLEQAIVQIGYLLCDELGNRDESIMIETSEGKIKEVHPSLFRDVVRRFNFRIEANSSVVDSVERRRDEELSLLNILLQAKAAGSNADIDKQLGNVIATYESKTPAEYIVPMLPGMEQGQQQGANSPIEVPQGQNPNTPAAQTEQIAGAALPF